MTEFRCWTASLAMGLGLLCIGAQVRPDYALAKGRAGRLRIGMPVSAIYKFFPKPMTRSATVEQEGIPTKVLQICLDESRRKVAIVVNFDRPNGFVESLESADRRFRTAAGIGVGSTVGELRRAYQDVHFAIGEGVTVAIVDALKISFELDETDPAIDPIPAGDRIKSVLVY